MIYRAYKDSEELRRAIAKKEKCKTEDVRCEGCQSVLKDGWVEQDEEWGRNCTIVRCQETRRLDLQRMRGIS